METPARYTLVVSDFHLGLGARLADGRPNPLEDFPWDEKFCEFLDYYCQKEYRKAEIDLVINGDFFNHIQLFAQFEDRPHIMDEATCLKYTQVIVEGHQPLFEALRTFAHSPGRRVIFTPGNHDMPVIWPAIQTYLSELVGGRVVFMKRAYIKEGVYIEHGDRYEKFHRLMYPYDDIITQGVENPVLNIPWGTYFLYNVVLPLKLKRPYVDKVIPFRNYLVWALANDFWLFLLTMMRLAFFALSTMFRNIGVHRFPPWYVLSMLLDLRVSPDLTRGALRIFYRYPDVKIVVFGHTHKALYLPMPGGRSYYNAGCWNEITGMSPGFMGTHKRFTFLEIEHLTHGPKASLKVWQGQYKPTEPFFHGDIG